MHILLALMIYFSPSALATNCGALLTEDGATLSFLGDPGFHWAARPDLHRLPPNVFASRMAALSYGPMQQLPTGLSREEHSFYQAVFDLFRDNKRVYRILKKIESEILLIAHPSSKPQRRKALEALFQAYEKEFGFDLVTISERIETEEFLKILAGGKVFNDMSGNTISLSLSPTLRALPGRWTHGRLSHRMQMHILFREVMTSPELYGGKNVLKYYKQLGDNNFNHRLNWSQTGVGEAKTGDQRVLFFQLFDSAENNGSSAGFYLEYQRHWPHLPLD